MGRRVTVLLVTGLLAATLAAGTGVAQAEPAQQTTIHFDPSGFVFVFPDPCNPAEEVTITGTSTGFITEVLTPTGDYMYTIHFQQQGTALGSEGSEYSFNVTGNDRFRSDVFTGTAIILLNNLGSGPNFAVPSVFHVTGLPDDPVVEVTKIGGPECRG